MLVVVDNGGGGGTGGGTGGTGGGGTGGIVRGTRSTVMVYGYGF